MKANFKFLLLLFLLLFPSTFLFSKEDPLMISEGGVPGQVEVSGENFKIYFEYDLSVEGTGNRVTLKDGSKNTVLSLDLSSTPEKATARQLWGEAVGEQDLGGKSKKKAPLAYKNPKFRSITLPHGDEKSLKNEGASPSKTSQEKTPEGGTITTLDYADGSKTVSYQLKNFKEETNYDQEGRLISRTLAGETQGIAFKKTQWEDGSLIREFSKPQGIIIEVFDQQKNVYTFSFLNANRDLLKEITCQKGRCDL